MHNSDLQTRPIKWCASLKAYMKNSPQKLALCKHDQLLDTTDGLTWSDTECYIAVPRWQQGASRVNTSQDLIWNCQMMSINRWLTVDGCLARQDDDYQLKPSVCVLEVAEHRLHLVSVSGVLTEARLTHDRHAGIRWDLLQMLRKIPGQTFIRHSHDWSLTIVFNC